MERHIDVLPRIIEPSMMAQFEACESEANLEVDNNNNYKNIFVIVLFIISLIVVIYIFYKFYTYRKNETKKIYKKSDKDIKLENIKTQEAIKEANKYICNDEDTDEETTNDSKNIMPELEKLDISKESCDYTTNEYNEDKTNINEEPKETTDNNELNISRDSITINDKIERIVNNTESYKSLVRANERIQELSESEDNLIKMIENIKHDPFDLTNTIVTGDAYNNIEISSTLDDSVSQIEFKTSNLNKTDELEKSDDMVKKNVKTKKNNKKPSKPVIIL